MLEKLVVDEMVKKFPSFYWNLMFVTALTKAFSTNLSFANASRNSPKYGKRHGNVFLYTFPRFAKKIIPFVEGSQAPPACPSEKINVSMKHSWDDTENRNRKTEVLGGKPLQMSVCTAWNLDLGILQVWSRAFGSKDRWLNTCGIINVLFSVFCNIPANIWVALWSC